MAPVHVNRANLVIDDGSMSDYKMPDCPRITGYWASFFYNDMP